MARVEVFVDDAVRGRFPGVCARTGEPADGMMRIEQSMGGGIGAGWLLLLLGPIGWIALVIWGFCSRPEVLTVRLPYSETAVDHDRRLHRTRNLALVVAVAALVASLLNVGHLLRPFWAVTCVVALVVAAVAQFAYWRASVRIELDASRRWVRLSNVHREFAHAVEVEARRTEAAARGTVSTQ